MSLPLGATDTPCNNVPGVIGGAKFSTYNGTLSHPPKLEDRKERIVAHPVDYDPFSEEGDHDWLLHNEMEGLFTQDADVDFFNVHSLVF